MTFADEIDSIANTRFVLARLEPARFINDNLTSIGASLYTATFSDTIVSKIERSGTVLTEVSGTPSSDGEWNFDEATGLLTMYLSSAPDTTSNVIVLFFYLFYTTDYDRIFPDNVDSGVDRCWNGRLKDTPSFSQSAKNITTSAKITSSSSPLTIENTDREFNRLIDEPTKTSFKNKKIKIWVYVGDERKDLLEGTTTNIGIGTNVSIRFNDGFRSILDDPAYMGDSFDECVATSSKYTDIDPAHINRVIPLLVGHSTPVSFNSAQTEWTFADSKKTYKGVNISATGSNLTDNRSWVLCRIPAGQSLLSKSPSFVGSGTSLTAANSDLNTVRFDVTKGHGIVVGDRFQWVTAGTTYYGIVFKISDRFAAVGEDEVSAYSTSQFGGAFGFSSVVFPAIPNITLVRGSDYFQPFHRDYSVSITATSGGNQLVTVTLDNSFETIDTAGTGLNDTLSVRPGSEIQLQLTSDINTSSPTKSVDLTSSNNVSGADMIYHIETTGGNINHSSVLEDIFSSAGLSTNATSFSNAESALAADVYMTIPMVGENTYKPYNTYAEAILDSTFGIAYLDSNNDVNYNLFDSNGSQSVSADDNNILKGSFSTSISYADITTEIQLENKHVGDEVTEKAGTSDIITSDVAKYLHQAEDRLVINHILADLAPVVGSGLQITKKLEWLQSPVITYKFSTATDQLLSEIDQRTTIVSSDVLGDSDTSTENKVISYTKGIDKTTITTIDVTEL